MPRKIDKLLTDKTAPVTGAAVKTDSVARTYQGIVEGTGAVTATIVIEGSRIVGLGSPNG